MDDAQQSSVPVAPNESKILGKLIKIAPTSEGIGHVWDVEVNESHDIAGMMNFARGRVGKVISVYVHPGMKKRFKKNDLIEARISFQGDEKGGAFFLMDDDVRKM